MSEIDCSEKRYCLYYRTNKRTRWLYADYGGSYASISSAIASLLRMREFVLRFIEYQICDMYDSGNVVLTGIFKKKCLV